MPEKITDTLLVVEPFTTAGVEYFVGDHVPTRHRAIRRVAAAHPDWFRMEYETAELDLEWLAAIEAEAEGRYQHAKRLKEAQKGQRERALREELKAQDQPQPDLERRYRQQQEEQRKHEQLAREERERELIESQAAPLTSGFNV